MPTVWKPIQTPTMGRDLYKDRVRPRHWMEAVSKAAQWVKEDALQPINLTNRLELTTSILLVRVRVQVG